MQQPNYFCSTPIKQTALGISLIEEARIFFVVSFIGPVIQSGEVVDKLSGTM